MAVGNDLGDDGGSRWWTTAGDEVGDNMGADVGNEDGLVDGG